MSNVSLHDSGVALGRSRMLALVLSFVHGGALLIILCMPIARWSQLVIAALIIGSFAVSLSRHALRSARKAIVGFAMEEGEACRWQHRGSEIWVRGRLIDRRVHAPLTLLRVRAEGRWRSLSVVIPADAVPPEAFRRLRVRLTLQSGAE